MKAPTPKKMPHRLECHGQVRTDGYFWLKDRENPDVIDYLNRENDYTEFTMRNHRDLRDNLYREMRSRIVEDDSSVPYLFNGYWYYTRFDKGAEHPIYCRKETNLDSDEMILLNENEMAKEFPYFEVVSFAVSLDNKTLVFAEDITGRRMYRVRMKNLDSGEITDLKLTNTSGDLVLSNNGNFLYYGLKDTETLRACQIRKLNLSDFSDELVFFEKDESFTCGIDKSGDLTTLFIGSQSSVTTEYHFKSAYDDAPFELFLERTRGHEYYPESCPSGFFIQTNDGAKNFRLVRCGREQRNVADWTDVQPHSKEVFIEEFEVFKDYLVIQEKINGLSQFKVYNLSDLRYRIVPVKEEAYTLYFGTNVDFNSTILRVGYSSMTTPHSVFDIDLNTFEWTLKKQTVVLGDFDSKNYTSERIWATAADGTKIPASLVYRNDTFRKNGTNPLLLYGYGAYGSTIDPYFSSIRLSLLDRGFVFVIAHIRGGEYLGRSWYEDGKVLKKMNSFTDFIAVAEFLVQRKYADPSNLFAMGGSAGGLLMGAVANLRPDLWKGIVSQVPFVDVITTMLDESIPLTTGEYDEWGDPRKKEFYDYILSYSPYDQLEKKDYPAMLITAGLHDSQVQYWEPAKYVAKLRELKTDQNPVMLFTNMDAGHGGASGRFESLKEVALEYAFIIAMSGNNISID